MKQNHNYNKHLCRCRMILTLMDAIASICYPKQARTQYHITQKFDGE